VPERRRLEAVLLDAGGTLVRLDFEWMAATLTGAGIAMDAARLARAEISGRRAYDRSREARALAVSEDVAPAAGAARPEDSNGIREYFGATLSAAGVPEGRIDEMLARFFERNRERGLWTRPAEGARAALDGIASLGLRLAVVSNSDGRARMHLGDCGVLDGLEFVVDSHHVGVEKPEPAIFATALERLGVAPGHALFVGDIRSVDAAGASAAGLDFVLIDPFGDYAAPGANAIREIGELPEWVSLRYDVAARVKRP
jgi:putative hydrolase of the HAD superfamily